MSLVGVVTIGGRQVEILAIIEALQSETKDFSCEFEGTFSFLDRAAVERLKLKDTGLLSTFSGTYIRDGTGRTYANTFERHEPDGRVVNRQLVMRPERSESEVYHRETDDPIGVGTVDTISRLNSDVSGCLGQIVLLDTIRLLAGSPSLRLEVTDDELDGIKLKVLTFSFKQTKGVYQRFWVDLARRGLVVRREVYGSDGKVMKRTKIQLATLEVGDVEEWFPVSGVIEGHASIKDGKVVISKEVTNVERIYIVDGSLEFNKNPDPGVFTVAYRVGAAVSDNLRKLKYEFGQQKPLARATKAQAERMLRAQLAEAEAQKKELVAAPRDGMDWMSWVPWLFGVAVLISLVAWQIQRRSH
jgi:hypothetical protein